MTFRSVIIGFIAAVFLSGYCYFNDNVVRQGVLVSDLMPVFLYGTLVFFLLLINPLLKRAKAKLELSGKELAAIGALVLVACSVPSWGLGQCLSTSIMLPHHYARARPGWAQHKVVESAPQRMLPDISQNEDHVLNGYVAGLSEGTRHVSPFEIPWGAWGRAFGFWLPLMATVALATLGLAVVFHRQWVHHEQLPYPISIFAHSLLPEEGQARGSIFRNRLFWTGATIVFAIHINNYLCRWFPQVIIPVRLYLDFTPLGEIMPTLVKGQGMQLLRPTIIFPVMALAYFIASDVSLSMAIVPWMFCFIFGALTTYGIALRSGDHMSVKLEAFLFTGGYLGILLMLMYSGRHYYWNVLKRSVGLQASAEVEEHAAWGMRAFLVGTVLFVVQLVAVGLDWQVALLYTGLALMIFTVVSRTIAETGAYHIGTEIFPGAILMGFFGATALGPRAIMIMFLVSVVILVAPGWSPMPFMVQGFKLADMTKVKISRTAGWAAPMLIIALLIAVPATIYWQYDQGAPKSGWPHTVSTFPFENMMKIKYKLEAQGAMELSESLSGWDRFAYMHPNWPCVACFFIALGLALAFGVCRLRFTRWPLHPVAFVFLGGHQGKSMAGSFLLGWLIKTAVCKYGGARTYQTLKPLMIGIIAGDMSARLVPMVVGTIYYMVTGVRPFSG